MIRYKCLRGLGGMLAAHPELRLHPARLDAVVDRTLRASFRALHARVVLERGGREREERRTSSHKLLVELLRDKERFAIERLFRTLGLRYPAENFRRIYVGLTAGTADERSSARELLESLLPKQLGGAVLGLTDDVDAEQRLRGGAAIGPLGPDSYAALLLELTREPSATLRSLAVSHAREIGLDLAESVEASVPQTQAGGGTHAT